MSSETEKGNLFLFFFSLVEFYLFFSWLLSSQGLSWGLLFSSFFLYGVLRWRGGFTSGRFWCYFFSLVSVGPFYACLLPLLCLLCCLPACLLACVTCFFHCRSECFSLGAFILLTFFLLINPFGGVVWKRGDWAGGRVCKWTWCSGTYSYFLLLQRLDGLSFFLEIMLDALIFVLFCSLFSCV